MLPRSVYNNLFSLRGKQYKLTLNAICTTWYPVDYFS
jgi:hypothetical protein